MVDLVHDIRQLARIDSLRRISGAKHHDYRLAPPMDPSRLAAWEARHGALPPSYRDLLTQVTGGGAGPGHGLLPLDLARGGGRGPLDPLGERTMLAIADGGCGIAHVLVLDGSERGEVWLDLRVTGDDSERLASDVAEWYRDWLHYHLDAHANSLRDEAAARDEADLFQVLWTLYRLGDAAGCRRVATRLAELGPTDERIRTFLAGVLEALDDPR